MRNILRCPVCEETLEKDGKTYRCKNGHNFDISKEGYVNLTAGKNIGGGDNKEMVLARRTFLDGDFYHCLCDTLKPLIRGTVLDACCGEGYFTKSIVKNAENSFAFDLSKDAVKHAAKRIPETEFFVANIASIPVSSSSVDTLTHIFAPMHEECARILKPDGKLLQVVPGKRHLWQMKEVLYEEPYENDNQSNLPDCFKIVNSYMSSDYVKIPHEQIKNLLKMTPYGYKTSKTATEKLFSLDCLETEIEFIVYEAIKKA